MTTPTGKTMASFRQRTRQARLAAASTIGLGAWCAYSAAVDWTHQAQISGVLALLAAGLTTVRLMQRDTIALAQGRQPRQPRQP